MATGDVTAASSGDPEVGLRAVAALRVLTERPEILQVDNARRLGWSWQDIAQRLGVTYRTAACSCRTLRTWVNCSAAVRATGGGDGNRGAGRGVGSVMA
jgi:hypothetical protein